MNPRNMSLRTRFFLLVALGSIVTATAAYVLHFRFLDNLERQTIDLRFSLRGDQAPPADVVIVKVDDVTFEELNEQWPFPRTMHARLFENIAKGKPKAIGFDIQFSEYASIAEDNALGNALFRHPGLAVLSTTEVDEQGGPNLIFDVAALRELRARAGNANLPTDPDGIIRRFPHEVEKLGGFAIVAAEIARDKLITTDEMGGDTQWIEYAGSPGTVTAYPYSRVLKGTVPPSVFKDKIVVIGATAPSLQDIHATPTGAVMSSRDPGQRHLDGTCRLSAAQPVDGMEHRAHHRAGASFPSSASGPARSSPSASASSATASSRSVRSSRSSRAAGCRPTSTRRPPWRWRP